MDHFIDLNGGVIENFGYLLASNRFRVPTNMEEVRVVGGTAPDPLVQARWARIYNGNYAAGENIDIQIKFDENITVGGNPRIPINIGGRNLFANYNRGSGSTLLTFRYTVSSTDRDTNGINVTSSIDLTDSGSPSPTLTSASGTTVDTAFEVPGNLRFIKVDSVMPFVSVWRTSRDGESISLPLRGGYTYDFTVDWGDGQTSEITSHDDSERNHRYADAGDHVVTITGTMQTLYFNNGGHKSKIREIRDLGDVGWTTLEKSFYGCSNLASISGGVLSEVTSMYLAFASVYFRSGDIQGWDTSNVTNMSRSFRALRSNGPDLRRLDTGRVTNMSHMFGYIYPRHSQSTTMYPTDVNPDVRDWNVSRVTTMNSMFDLNTVANPDVSQWDTSNIRDMYDMFNGALSANPNFTGKNFRSLESYAHTGLSGAFNNAHSFDSANYSALLIALERTNSTHGLVVSTELGLGLTINQEAQNARSRGIRDHDWRLSD